MVMNLAAMEEEPLLEYQCFLSSASGSTGLFRSAAFSLGLRPGPVVWLFVEGAEGSISSQIAVQLAYEAMVEGVLGVLKDELPASVSAIDIVQEAFRLSNQRVYQYAHRMLSGGKLSARGLIAAYDGKRVSVGQVGSFEAVLYRDGKLLRFHEPSTPHGEQQAGMLDRFIGANAQILVDLASVRVRDTDIVCVSSLAPGQELFQQFHAALRGKTSLDETGKTITDRVLSTRTSAAGHTTATSLFLLHIGSPVIVLRNVVFEELS